MVQIYTTVLKNVTLWHIFFSQKYFAILQTSKSNSMSIYKKRTPDAFGIEFQNALKGRAKAAGRTFLSVCREAEDRLAANGSKPKDLRGHFNMFRWGLPENVTLAQELYKLHKVREESARGADCDKMHALDSLEKQLRENKVLDKSKSVQYFLVVERILLELEAAKR